MRIRSVWIMAGSLFFVGCSTPVNITPIPTGGSKGDGVVEMEFSYQQFQEPVIDWEAANRSAEVKCRAWGYSSAKKFEGMREVCNNRTIYGCNPSVITVTYQCLE